MSCTYNDFGGKCQLFDITFGTYENNPVGWDKDGNCVCDSDPCPFDSCENFEPIDPTEYEDEEVE